MSGVEQTRNLVAQNRSGWVTRGLSGPTRDTLRRICAQQGWTLLQADVHGLASKGEVMDRLANALQLPDHFGKNWDALADCLADVGKQTPGVLMRMKGLNSLPPELAETLVDVLDERVQEPVGEGCVPFIVVADAPAPRFSRE